MNRRDLIELFLNCDPPSDARELAFVDGDEREEEGGGGLLGVRWIFIGQWTDIGERGCTITSRTFPLAVILIIHYSSDPRDQLHNQSIIWTRGEVVGKGLREARDVIFRRRRHREE